MKVKILTDRLNKYAKNEVIEENTYNRVVIKALIKQGEAEEVVEKKEVKKEIKEEVKKESKK